MAISNRTATTANTGAAAAASLAVNKPTGTVAGDVLITTISVNNGSSCTITTLAGWTLIARTNNTTVLGQGVYYRVVDGTEGSSFTWSFTSELASIVCNAYSGVDPMNPIAGTTSLSKTAASTSATFSATAPNAEVVYGVLCCTSSNATGTTTMTTASSGYTTDGDTCTTATTFIETVQMDQHTTYGLPLANVTPGNGTFSRSVTDIDSVVFLRPILNFASGNFAVDFAAANEQLVSTGVLSFTGVTTGYRNETLCLVVAGDASTSSQTVTSTGGLTWTQTASSATVHGAVYVYTAVANSPITNQTIGITDTGDASTNWGGVLYSFVGANTAKPVGATKTGLVSSSAALSDTVTTTGANSWVWAVCDDYNLNEAHTLGANQSLVATEGDASAGNTYFIWRQTAITAANGTTVTMNVTTLDFYVYALFEILASPPLSKSVKAIQSVNRAGTY